MIQTVVSLQDYSKQRRRSDAKAGEFRHFAGNRYRVTGVAVNGRRFAIITSDPHYFLGINVSRGSKWVKYVDEPNYRRIAQRWN